MDPPLYSGPTRPRFPKNSREERSPSRSSYRDSEVRYRQYDRSRSVSREPSIQSNSRAQPRCRLPAEQVEQILREILIQHGGEMDLSLLGNQFRSRADRSIQEATGQQMLAFCKKCGFEIDGVDENVIRLSADQMASIPPQTSRNHSDARTMIQKIMAEHENCMEYAQLGQDFRLRTGKNIKEVKFHTTLHISRTQVAGVSFTQFSQSCGVYVKGRVAYLKPSNEQDMAEMNIRIEELNRAIEERTRKQPSSNCALPNRYPITVNMFLVI